MIIRINSYEKKGIKIIHIKKNNKGYLKIEEILSFLNKMNINRLLIEGGSTLSSSFLDKNIVNLVYWFSSQNDLNLGKSLNKYDKKLNNLRDSQNFLLKDSINLRDNKLEIFSFRKD